jgi:DNA-binding NarL/FixJ family response regulator
MMGCQLLADALRRARFDVTECAVNSQDLMRAIDAHAPDVALVSVHLQDGRTGGIEALRSIRRAHPRVRCVILLEDHDRDLVLTAFRAGAKGVFCRTEPFTLLCKCIRAVRAGQVWIGSNDLEFVLESLINVSKPAEVPPRAVHRLTRREQEIVSLVRDGLSNRDIAQKLFLSEHTVKNHLFHIFEKLGVGSRVELLLVFGDETPRVA